MKRAYITRLLIFFICGFFWVSFAACSIKSAGIRIGSGEPSVKRGPPPHAPAHGYRAKYRYYYYPEVYVYFDISRKAYFYLEGDRWRMSALLPHSFHVRLGQHVTIEMNSDKPYTQFASHKKKYPPGQLKKKGKWTKKK